MLKDLFKNAAVSGRDAIKNLLCTSAARPTVLLEYFDRRRTILTLIWYKKKSDGQINGWLENRLIIRFFCLNIKYFSL